MKTLRITLALIVALVAQASAQTPLQIARRWNDSLIKPKRPISALEQHALDSVMLDAIPTGAGGSEADPIWVAAASAYRTKLQNDLLYAPMSHPHIIADITGLQAALNAKAALTHTHPPSALTQGGAVTGQALVWNGAMWAPGTVSGGGGGNGTPEDAVDLSDQVDGIATVFDLGFTPANPRGLIVDVEGVINHYDYDYTIAGDQLTFNWVIPDGLKLHVQNTVGTAPGGGGGYPTLIVPSGFNVINNATSSITVQLPGTNLEYVAGNGTRATLASMPVSLAQAAADAAVAAAAANASNLTSGTIDGNRLPGLSATKRGSAPPTGTPSGKFHRDDDTWAAIPGGGDALTSSPLNQFAATTSTQLRGVLSDETGTGPAVFGTSPNITAPTGLVKGDVGLGNVDNTSDANKPVSTATQTALNAKAALSHTHALSDITQSAATTGQVPQWNGSAWVPTTIVGGAVTVQDEGTSLTTGATTLNFVGAGVTASGTGAAKTITIPGGGSTPFVAVTDSMTIGANSFVTLTANKAIKIDSPSVPNGILYAIQDSVGGRSMTLNGYPMLVAKGPGKYTRIPWDAPNGYIVFREFNDTNWVATKGQYVSTFPAGNVAYWRFNETSGSRADAQGSYTLTDHNSTLYNPGILGNAALFVAGNVNYLTNSTAGSFTGPFSVNIWFRSSNVTGDQYIISRWDYTNSRKEWALIITGGNIGFFITPDGTTNTIASTSAAGLGDNAWHMLTMVYSGTTVKLYIDAAQAVSANYSSGVYTSALNQLLIGTDISFSSAAALNARLDEGSLFNVALSSASITQLYNNGAAYPHP